ncbi:TlpA family protein disulfide reductase [Horticoccus sp. 23ND18S-11]|uniref:TlpA family protein disulfide reductase n=1 Tax=Horticoccus sp. 23ND18S-11 TaxID=3391832 RepID=UPI0039C96F55
MNRPALRHRFVRAFYIILSLAAVTVVPWVHAQAGAPTADEAWRTLTSSLAPRPPAAPALRTNAGALAAARREHADRLFEASRQAGLFHQRHPGDPRAAQARKLEITSALASVQLGRTAGEAAALALATAFRADKNQLREHRFEVALAAERLTLALRPGAKRPPDDGRDHERMADALRREFGPIPEVHGLYSGLAAAADTENANRLATQLLEMRPPPFATATAQAVTTRYGLIGRPLSLRLTDLAGRTFELPATAAASGPTVLYVWTPDSDGSKSPFNPLRRSPAAGRGGVRWIYLGLGATRAAATSAQAGAPFPGTHCSDDGGARSALAQRLNVRSSPTLFVFNRAGVLTGIGRVDELTALLAGANR